MNCAGQLRALRRHSFGPSLWQAALFLFATLAIASAAAPVALDLGDGLRYFRVHEVPGELPPADAKSGPMVVDLRNCRLAPDSAASLEAWLRFRTSPTIPVLILVNGGSAAGLGAVLTANRALPGLLTLGLPAPGFTPDLLVTATAEDDQRAYNAFEHGTPLATLLTENADKPRSDEAAIVRERTNPPEDVSDEDAPDEPGGSSEPADQAKAPAETDATVQKAVQVHRALRAVKRI